MKAFHRYILLFLVSLFLSHQVNASGVAPVASCEANLTDLDLRFRLLQSIAFKKSWFTDIPEFREDLILDLLENNHHKKDDVIGKLDADKSLTYQLLKEINNTNQFELWTSEYNFDRLLELLFNKYWNQSNYKKPDFASQKYRYDLAKAPLLKPPISNQRKLLRYTEG